jgi:hypothetical protein
MKTANRKSSLLRPSQRNESARWTQSRQQSWLKNVDRQKKSQSTLRMFVLPTRDELSTKKSYFSRQGMIKKKSCSG